MIKKQEEVWTEVIKRRTKEDKIKKEKKSTLANKSTSANTTTRNKQNLPNVTRRKMPKTAAVSIKGDTKQGFF